MQHDLPRGYDLVVVVRPHEPLLLADYQRILSSAAVKLHGVWSRRTAEAEDPRPGPLPEYREREYIFDNIDPCMPRLYLTDPRRDPSNSVE